MRCSYEDTGLRPVFVGVRRFGGSSTGPLFFICLLYFANNESAFSLFGFLRYYAFCRALYLFFKTPRTSPLHVVRAASFRFADPLRLPPCGALLLFTVPIIIGVTQFVKGYFYLFSILFFRTQSRRGLCILLPSAF